MGRKTELAAVVGGHIGYKAGEAIGNKISRRKIIKSVPYQVHNVYGPRVALEVMKKWEDGGCRVDFPFSDAAQKIDDRLLYQNVFSAYGENAADFVESKLLKSRMKGIELNLDKELGVYLSGLGVDFDNEKLVSYLKKTYRKDDDSIRSFDLIYGGSKSGVSPIISNDFADSIFVAFNFMTLLAILGMMLVFGPFPEVVEIMFIASALGGGLVLAFQTDSGRDFLMKFGNKLRLIPLLACGPLMVIAIVAPEGEKSIVIGVLLIVALSHLRGYAKIFNLKNKKK